ncbi:MAG: thioredoxin [Alphaproteobacteria bacterium]|nr:thiol reductase thioredoxin [Rhodospirillaceae bacterium]MDP6407640.1 thioredoxin [Alphaproteobacteria bacterium]MDP6622492.1 thioredoxin [Alphaproteobacteria bacterium]|tara:strand:- start:1880 stop:3349 length:1470 start_codon:yes stop_codon:yes gene_type:complete
MSELSDGLAVFVKRDCPTCVQVVPVLAEMRAAGLPLVVYSQDDPGFPEGLDSVADDTSLERSWRHGIEIVPTLLRIGGGRETGRCVGWERREWEDLVALEGPGLKLGSDLPEARPGCGSRSVEPGMAERLEIEFGDVAIASRPIPVGAYDDEVEICYERGWSDGLPVVPPTRERVFRMLQGTGRSAGEVIGAVPPNLVPCSVEKVAVNAVMAGCKPEYLPLVLAAVEAALLDEFCMHGLLCTTWFAGPVVIVNGPVAGRVGMNSQGNALGQGNRANATIGRALQLVIRNVGGGRPGEIDRSALGNPGKYTFCFAEDEAGSCWESLAVERGIAPGASAVTLFAGDGVQPILDQKSRTPESLARTLAAGLRAVGHPKLATVPGVSLSGDALVVITPEHQRVFADAGWSKQRLQNELETLLTIPGSELVAGAGGIAEGIPESFAAGSYPKFRPGGLLLVRAGGGAGMFSAIISGWVASGEMGSIPATKEVTE